MHAAPGAVGFMQCVCGNNRWCNVRCDVFVHLMAVGVRTFGIVRHAMGFMECACKKGKSHCFWCEGKVATTCVQHWRLESSWRCYVLRCMGRHREFAARCFLFLLELSTYVLCARRWNHAAWPLCYVCEGTLRWNHAAWPRCYVMRRQCCASSTVCDFGAWNAIGGAMFSMVCLFA